MATLVGGIGTAHTPMLGMDPSRWREHGDLELDSLRKKNLQPTSRSETDLADELQLGRMQDRYHRMQLAIENIAVGLREMQPDLLVIVGDDQRELFLDDGMPAIALFWGETMWDRPPGPGIYPPTMSDAYRWYHGEEEEAYQTCAPLGLHLVEQLMAEGFDTSQFSRQNSSRTLGHAFTWVYRRMLEGDHRPPFVPVILNTYYPPNQPTPARCVQLGTALAAAIRSWPSKARVALVASGGLSHPIIDEELDQYMLQALRDHDRVALESLPVKALREGSSEIRNWITVGSALPECDVEVVDYIPAYRSMAGSGCGAAFAIWRTP